MLKTYKTLILCAVASFLSIGAASDAEACCINVSLWVNVGVESTSPVFANEKLCMDAASEIIAQGWKFQGTMDVQPRLNGLMFTKQRDGRRGLATLFCAANVIEELLDELP